MKPSPLVWGKMVFHETFSLVPERLETADLQGSRKQAVTVCFRKALRTWLFQLALGVGYLNVFAPELDFIFLYMKWYPNICSC